MDPWLSMDTHGSPWIPMDIHGYRWMPIDTPGYPWLSMEIHGDPLLIQKLLTIQLVGALIFFVAGRAAASLPAHGMWTGTFPSYYVIG